MNGRNFERGDMIKVVEVHDLEKKPMVGMFLEYAEGEEEALCSMMCYSRTTTWTDRLIETRMMVHLFADVDTLHGEVDPAKLEIVDPDFYTMSGKTYSEQTIKEINEALEWERECKKNMQAMLDDRAKKMKAGSKKKVKRYERREKRAQEGTVKKQRIVFKACTSSNDDHDVTKGIININL